VTAPAPLPGTELRPGAEPAPGGEPLPGTAPLPGAEPSPGARHRLDRTLAVRVLVGLGLALVLAASTAAVHGLRLPTAAVSAPAAAPPPVATGASAVERPEGTTTSRSLTSRVDRDWAAAVAEATGVPMRALLAYAAADLVIDAEQPGCGLGWNTIAAIGATESDHGRHGGAVLGEDGYPEPAVLGVVLDGTRAGTAAVRDTDGGRWDGDTVWDRAVGPMQFIPSTWAAWGADADGDGDADPNQIDDAALAAARYLCASGSMSDVAGWRAAVLSYNRSEAYVDRIAATADRYARLAAGVG
jgi:membrane-bound lytic murein transglycosylase B